MAGEAINGVFNLLGIGANAIATSLQEKRQQEYNLQSMEQQNKYNQENMNLQHELNEESANNAQARSIELYNLTQSPAAKLQQLQDAGLSPALLGSGSGTGGSTPSGSQAAGTGLPSTTAIPNIARNPLENATMALTFAQTKKTLAEAESINKETGREEGKYDLILAQMEANIKQTNELIDNLKEQTENYKAERRLTNLQSDYQELVNGIKNQTAQFDITKVMQECEYMDEQITALKKGNYWKDKETQAELDKMLEETKTIRMQRVVMQAQADYYEAMEKQTESQTKLNESLTKKTDQEVESILKDIEVKAAEIQNIEERTKYIEKEYKLKMGIQITNTVLNGILGTISAIKGTPFVPLSTQSDATVTNIR